MALATESAIPTLEEFSSFMGSSISEIPKEIPSLEDFSKTIKAPQRKVKSSREVFQPETPRSNWSIDNLSSIQSWYQENFGTNLPAQVGQKAIHNKWNYDHRNSVDVNLNPSSKEGKALIAYLKQNEIPHIPFSHAIPGVATGAHIHIGLPSHKTTNKYTIGTTLSSSQKMDENIPSLEEFSNVPAQETALPSDTKDDTISQEVPSLEEFSQQKIDYTNLDPSLATDPNKLDFKVGTKKEYAILKLGMFSKPHLAGSSVFDIGDPISTEVTFANHINLKKAKDVNQVTDAWLVAWNPEYAELNQKFREETKGLSIALVDSPANLKPLGGGKYHIISRPSKNVQALFEAYKKGGLPAFNATNNLINKQADAEREELIASKNNIEQIRKDHPYAAAIKSAAQDEVIAWLNLSRNTKGLAKAIWIGNTKGYDSQEYIDGVNQELAESSHIEDLQANQYQPPNILGKAIKGLAGGAFAFPRFTLIGRAGGAALPLMTYVENLHRGNRQAALSALPMAVMVGSSHGLGQFIAADEGLGNIAPFKKISKQNLSIFQDSLIKGKSVSIEQLTPLERQLLLRGTNALTMTGASLIENPHQHLSDVITTLTVGLSLPVGKGPRKAFLPEDYIQSSPPPKEITRIAGEAPRILVPITKAPIYGENKLPILESQRGILPVIYPSSESPNVGKYKEAFDPNQFVGETEKGFQARGQGQSVYLDLDTAALSLIDLRRAWQDGTINNKNLPLAENLARQKAVQNAIDHLEKVVPKEAQEFFEKNEEIIRSSLKTNQEALNARQEFGTIGEARDLLLKQGYNTVNRSSDGTWYLNKRIGDKLQENTIASDVELKKLAGWKPQTKREPSSILPHEIVPNEKLSEDPIVRAKQIELNQKLGDAGIFNAGTNREKFVEKYDNFFKITRNSGLQPMTFGLDILAKKSADAAYLGAFVIEDMYKRNIEPTVDLVLNKFRTTLGDFGGKLTEEHARFIFEKGMDYYKSNQADPFFSRMKQEAMEKLPNRLDATQAMNFFNANKNEFEWTAGLKEFIEGKIQRKERVYKQEVIDIINKGQVRVEAAIASDETFDKAKVRIRDIRNELANPTKITNERELRSELLELQKVKHTEYSPKWYSGELLELPGGKNTIEVKLITPLKGGKYKSPHWDEDNVVAHYNTTDRTTIDNKNIYFSEEFQSDWNHDIRERGLKLTTEQRIDEKLRLEKLIREQENKDRETERLNGQVPFNEELDLLRTRLDILDRNISNKVEPNPFMGHAWKELVFKRFLRDAVITKDEDGNYKYEGIGWTTARQQKERYGKILGGKDFDWQKTSTGKYTFRLGQPDATYGTIWEAPHELVGITLERFAELTTKEAAKEVRSQEKESEEKLELAFEARRQLTSAGKSTDEINNRISQIIKPNGKFSLKEAVELRSGSNKFTINRKGKPINLENKLNAFDTREAATKWAKDNNLKDYNVTQKYDDYDNAFILIAKKIGKRFGARYDQKEIITATKGESFYSMVKAKELFDNGEDVYGYTAKDAWEKINNGYDIAKYTLYSERIPEKVHFLEITPSMRESLSKEGFPLYGFGGEEKLTNPEAGIRNRITTREGFDEHRNSLVENFNNNLDLNASENNGTVFNSGLNPDAFIDQAKLLYSRVKDFAAFSKELIKRFGEQVTPFLQDLWIQVKGLAKATSERVDDFLDYTEGKNKTKEFREGGFFRNAPDSEKNYKLKKRKAPVFGWYSIWRGVGLAQLRPEAGEVYDIMRGGQRVKNAFESSVLFKLRDANNKIKGGFDQQVADNVWIGNEKGHTWSDAELAAGDATLGRPALNPAQIAAYRDVRAAMDINLDIRKETKLYSMREKARRLNDQLSAATPGTPEWDSIASKLLDLADSMRTVDDHFKKLKAEGYISTKRQGKIVAYIEDAQGKLYQHFNSLKEAGNWINQQIANGANPATQDIYDLKIPARLRKAAANLTPGQFEDLIDSSGVNPHSSEVETIRNEVYSKFPSFGYELKRDFVRGYDRNWQFVLESIAHQTETYANSFYSRVAGEEGIKKLDALGVQANDYNLYEVLQKFIDHEISSPERIGSWAAAGHIRKGVYLFQLAFDVNQLYLNALAQPISQTYSYFSRVEHNGIKLSGNEINTYFLRGGKLAATLARRSITGGGLVPAEFDTIYTRLQQEKVIEPEFNRSLLELETENTVSGALQKTTGSRLKRIEKQYEHWAGIFMRNGEKTTRTHVAAEAYLVGKEKFKLSGEDLVTFMVRAVDATQTNPSRAEAPLVVRGSQNTGEFRKLLYQFNAFNHMWLENLALNVRSDFLKDQYGRFEKGNRKLSLRSTSRHLAPLILMGGIKGLPLAGFSSNLYTLITGDDPKKHFDKLLGKDSFLESLALYGITTSPALSQKLTPGVPLVDSIKIGNTVGESFDETFSATNMIPAFATTAQIGRGLQDLFSGNWTRTGGELIPIKPLRNISTAIRYQNEGIKTRGRDTILSRKKVTNLQKAGQVIGLQPAPLIQYYEAKRTEKLQRLHSTTGIKKLKRRLEKIF